jgi:hypothetical protein
MLLRLLLFFPFLREWEKKGWDVWVTEQAEVKTEEEEEE